MDDSTEGGLTFYRDCLKERGSQIRMRTPQNRRSLLRMDGSTEEGLAFYRDSWRATIFQPKHKYLRARGSQIRMGTP